MEKLKWVQKSNKYCLIAVLFSLSFFTSCKKFIETDPPNSKVVRETVFNSDATATSAVLGLYTRMNNMGFAAGNVTSSVTFLSGTSSDELWEYSSNDNLLQFYFNRLVDENSNNLGIWSSLYNTIYMTNSVLEGLSNSAEITASVKVQLEGEAKFIRAFCYFYLVNLYGDVPLILSTDYQQNTTASRTSITIVYDQIILDLSDSKSKLNVDYLKVDNMPYTIGVAERVRPNRSAAATLLSRVYLYRGNWAAAETEATDVINNSFYTLLTTSNINNVFKKNSTEAIWQLMPVGTNVNTWEGKAFILITEPSLSTNSVAISPQLLSAFQASDARRINWISSYSSGLQTWYYPFKYKAPASATTTTEYAMVLRLAELYLIRAEARAQQDNIRGAQSDLNIIRNRAGLPDTTASDKTSLLAAIELERQLELFTEWGHRWLDLKRTQRSSNVLTPLKGSNWQSTDVLFPIPEADILKNPMLTQNPGY